MLGGSVAGEAAASPPPRLAVVRRCDEPLGAAQSSGWNRGGCAPVALEGHGPRLPTTGRVHDFDRAMESVSVPVKLQEAVRRSCRIYLAKPGAVVISGVTQLANKANKAGFGAAVITSTAAAVTRKKRNKLRGHDAQRIYAQILCRLLSDRANSCVADGRLSVCA